jgi:hypothetical protein
VAAETTLRVEQRRNVDVRADRVACTMKLLPMVGTAVMVGA